MEMTTVVDAAASSLWLGASKLDPLGMLAKGFERALGATPRASRSAARAALHSDQHAFVGYARWEINEQWDSASPRESLSSYTRGQRFYARLGKQKLPTPFALSVAFLNYLYARDVFVRRSARSVGQLRRSAIKGAPLDQRLKSLLLEAEQFEKTLGEGRRAATAMWRRTRHRDPSNPNQLILRSDAARLREWRRWLKRCQLELKIVHTRTTVMGRAQLLFTVHNFEPALQKIVVELAQPDGTWRELRSRFTIEFQAKAAAPRSAIKREFSVPLDTAVHPALKVRIGVRGVGRVKVSDVTIDGVAHPSTGDLATRKGKVIGLVAPRKGLPALVWDRNIGRDLTVSFGRK
jgi:hypothetical protein